MRWTVDQRGHDDRQLFVERHRRAPGHGDRRAPRGCFEGGLENPDDYDHYQFQRGYLHALAMAADKDEDLQQIVRNALSTPRPLSSSSWQRRTSDDDCPLLAYESREFWNVRTECCGADETFIGDAGSGGPVPGPGRDHRMGTRFEKDETTEEAR